MNAEGVEGKSKKLCFQYFNVFVTVHSLVLLL